MNWAWEQSFIVDHGSLVMLGYAVLVCVLFVGGGFNELYHVFSFTGGF